jgi:hypothetical protein
MIGMTAGMTVIGVDRNGFKSGRFSIQLTEAKAAGIFGGFCVFDAGAEAGKTGPACWTSPGRFAKRRPLAKAFRGRLPGA